MWKSARNKQLAWFICIGIFNTIASCHHLFGCGVRNGPQPALIYPQIALMNARFPNEAGRRFSLSANEVWGRRGGVRVARAPKPFL